jgi:hypothetical protein
MNDWTRKIDPAYGELVYMGVRLSYPAFSMSSPSYSAYLRGITVLKGTSRMFKIANYDMYNFLSSDTFTPYLPERIKRDIVQDVFIVDRGVDSLSATNSSFYYLNYMPETYQSLFEIFDTLHNFVHTTLSYRQRIDNERWQALIDTMAPKDLAIHTFEEG